MGLALSGLPSLAAVIGGVSLSGHVPAVLKSLTANGNLSGSTNLHLAIGLPLKNQSALTNLLVQLYDPSSTNFHKFLTPDEFTAQFGPSTYDYQSVINFANQNGLTVTATHPNRMIVDVVAPAASIQKAFNVTLNTYPHPKETRNFYSPDREPTVPANVPILHISGLDNYQLPHPAWHVKPAGVTSPALGSSPGGGYMGKDFRNAYVPGTTLDGTGQMVGLLQFASGFFQSDISAYEQLAVLPNVSVVPVLLDGYNGGPGFANDEVSLDIEMVISMAPGVSKIFVFEGENTDDILNSMASSNQVKQLSASWLYPIDLVSEQIFQQFAAQGQSFFNASGDYDAYPPGTVFTPADDPHVTVVGGTTLTTLGTGGYSYETVWNWDNLGADGVGSSGGISSTYPIPYWQTNINMSLNGGSTTLRNLPDVALTGDNVFIIFGGGLQGIGGGTSCATPLWAGFTALANQQAAAQNKPNSLGFLNPALYTIAAGANYTNCFHDVTLGSNTWSGSPQNFYAIKGYDLCTGLGTPNGVNLINALVGAAGTHISAPLPPYGTTLSALNGANPNGSWNVFVVDDQVLNSGIISNGWFMTLTLANPVGLAADLGVTMSASANTVLPGGDLTYTITVTNYGFSASTNVQVQDLLPAGATLVSAVADEGTINNEGNSLVWNVVPGTNLIAGTGSKILVTIATPNTTGLIYNSALVTSTTPDPNPDDDVASLSVNLGTPTPFVLTGTFVYQSGQFLFSVNGSSGQVVVQASTNLINWVPVFTNPTPYTVPFSFTDPSASNYQDRFYRAVTVQ